MSTRDPRQRKEEGGTDRDEDVRKTQREERRRKEDMIVVNGGRVGWKEREGGEKAPNNHSLGNNEQNILTFSLLIL